MDFFFSQYYGTPSSNKRPHRSMATSPSQPSPPEEGSGEDSQSCTNPSLETIQNDKLFVDRFAVLYNNEVFSDIILRVGNDRFFAHKFMLITCSEVFEAMLNEMRWRESSQPEIALTEEVECEPVFSCFLKYIYTGSVGLNTDNVLPILLLADKYSISMLHQVCVDYMLHHIVESPDTNRTLSWYQYSKMTGNLLLVEKCLKFIQSNFDIILKTYDWLELTKGEIVEFLRTSDVVVNSEFELWIQLEKWLTSDNNRDNLAINLADIIPLLRFTMIPPKDLLNIEESALCQDNKDAFTEKLHAAYRHHSLLFDDVEMKSGDETFRNYTSEMYGLCNDLSLLNYTTVGKIDSKISRRFIVPLQFLSQVTPSKQKHTVSFEVSFWPKGHYTTFTLYGNHIGRQTENTSLTIRRGSPTASTSKPLPKMETTITFIIFSVKNSVRYVAFTYSKSHTFSQSANSLTEENIIPLKRLTAENSSYLINGNLDAKLFIKVQNIVPEEE